MGARALVSLIMAVSVGVGAGAYGTAYAGSDGKGPPNHVRQALDKDYPGWRAPAISREDLDTCWKEKTTNEPTVAMADLDGDGHPDYAVEIETDGRVQLLAFLARDDKFTKQVIDPDLQKAGILTVAKKGERYFDHERNRSGSYSLDTVSVVYCESSAVAYVRAPKGFRRVFTSD